MALSVTDLEQLRQDYDRNAVSKEAMSQVPQIFSKNNELEYISLQLNGKNPIDALIIEGLLAYRANDRSVSGLVRLLMFHYFSYTPKEDK